MLDWLHQEYWSRQMSSQLTEDWDSSSEEEDEEEFAKRYEEELLRRQKEIDAHSEWPFVNKTPSVCVSKGELQGRTMTETDQTFTYCTYSSEEINTSITIILQYKINCKILASFVVYWEYFMSLKFKALALFKSKGVKYFDLSRTQKVTVKAFII